jgi:AcrR family transcriptional regulator
MGRPPRITRAQILDAARDAFAQRGFEAATLADIAAALKVSPAAILRYFKTKQELFAAAMSSRDIAWPEPISELAGVEPDADPRVVLRRFAEQMVPLLQSVIGSAIAVEMHARSQRTTLVVPFDTAAKETPPRRGLRILSNYFQRAMNTGRIRMTHKMEPDALALLFIGQLQSYVLLHEVLKLTPVYPLDLYLDALIDLWVNGAITGAADVEEDRPARRAARGSNRGAAVLAETKPAEAPGPVRNRRSPDGAGGVAGRRPRGPRSRR